MYEVVRTATVRILERLGYLTVNSKVVSEQLERNFHGAVERQPISPRSTPKSKPSSWSAIIVVQT